MLLKYIVTQLVFFLFFFYNFYELLIFEFSVLVCAYAYIYIYIYIYVWVCVWTLDLALAFILNQYVAPCIYTGTIKNNHNYIVQLYIFIRRDSNYIQYQLTHFLNHQFLKYVMVSHFIYTSIQPAQCAGSFENSQQQRNLCNKIIFSRKKLL